MVAEQLYETLNVRTGPGEAVFGDRYTSVEEEGHCRAQRELGILHPRQSREARDCQREATRELLDYPWSSLAGGYALPAVALGSRLEKETGVLRMTRGKAENVALT
jgi:hypothetical protein